MEKLDEETYRRLRVVDLIHQRAQAHAVAQEHKLVLVLRALLSGPCKELDCIGPFLVGELRFARECVEVRDECGDQLECAGVFAKALVQLLDAAW